MIVPKIIQINNTDYKEIILLCVMGVAWAGNELVTWMWPDWLGTRSCLDWQVICLAHITPAWGSYIHVADSCTLHAHTPDTCLACSCCFSSLVCVVMMSISSVSHSVHCPPQPINELAGFQHFGTCLYTSMLRAHSRLHGFSGCLVQCEASQGA